jgi:WD40 repeat protein
MARLESWLDTDDAPVFLVTGPPGTGKTSFAAQLVLAGAGLFSADLVLAHFCDASDERTLDAMDFVLTLSQHLALRIPGFADALASSAAGVSAVVSINSSQTIGTVEAGASVANVRISLPRDVPTRQAFARLVRHPLDVVVANGWDQRLLVVVDDVSSGFQYDSEDNIARLIGVVADNPAELPAPLRFVVTSRPDPWVLRSLPARAVDLRDDLPPGADDIQRYVGQRLAGVPERGRQAWAEHLGGAADGNFLYARHMIDHLLTHEAVLDRGPAGSDLPSGLTDLYRRWFTTNIARSRDTWWDYHQPVLSALTVAQGAGLTLDQLAGITRLPASRVRRTLEECAQFLLGSPRSGPVRIYHGSFRDFLAAEEVSTDEAHRAVADYFRKRHGDNWFEADQYARDHLATHATATGDLAPLVSRLDFLVVAEPTTVLHQLRSYDVGDPVTRAYQRTGWLLVGLTPDERAAYLELALREAGETEAAEAFPLLPVSPPWRPLWASSLRHRPGQVVGTHAGGVLDMLTFEHDNGTAAVTINEDGELRVWDLSTRTLAITWELSSAIPTARLALLWKDDQAFVVVASPRQVWLVDLTQELWATVPTRAGSMVTAVTTGEVAGRDVLVLGYHDGIIETVDPDSGQPVTEQPQAHEGPVLAVSAPYRDVVVSGGADGRVILWSLADGDHEELVADRSEAPTWVAATAFRPTTGSEWLLATGFSDGETALITSSEDGRRMYSIKGHSPAAQRCGFVSVAANGVYSLTSRQNMGSSSYAEILRGHREQRQSDIDHWRQYWRTGFAGSYVKVPWPKKIVRLSGGVNSMDIMPGGDRVHLATGGEDGQVELVELVGGDLTRHHVQPAGEPISAVRFAHVDTRPVLLTAESSQRGLIREWSLESSEYVGELDAQVIDFDSLTDPVAGPVVAIADAAGTVKIRVGNVWRELGATGLALAGVRLWQRGNRLSVIACGRTDAAVGIRVWELRAEDEPVATDVVFAELTDIRLVAPSGEELFAVAYGEAHPFENLWLLTDNNGSWECAPVPRLTAERGDDFGMPADPDWMTPVAGTDGRQVLVGDYGTVTLVSLDHRTFYEMQTFVSTAPASIMLGGEPAMVVGCGAVVCVERLRDAGTVAEYLYRSEIDLVSVGASEDGSLVAAGTEDGQLLIWRAPDHPEHVVSLGSPAKQIAVLGQDTVLVRTSLGIAAIRFGS